MPLVSSHVWMHIDISSEVARPSSQMLSFLLLTLGIPCHRAYTALNPSANYPLATNNFIATAPGGTAYIYQSVVQAICDLDSTHACAVAWDAELAHSKMTRLRRGQATDTRPLLRRRPSTSRARRWTRPSASTSWQLPR